MKLTNMPIELKKIAAVELRSLGLDEKWLQNQISDDPGILGLGELEIAGREHRQPIGGRIDFLLRDAEAETYYEVEVILGELDASHIIRTIEYWDIERQRRPSFTHHAVIVAEHITARSLFQAEPRHQESSKFYHSCDRGHRQHCEGR